MPQNPNKVDLSTVNKKRELLVAKPAPKNPASKNNGPARDELGKFSSGGGGMRQLNQLNWRRTLPVILVVALVGGYFVLKGFALSSTSNNNPYSCQKLNSAYPKLRLGVKDGLTGIRGERCVSALQWVFRSKAGLVDVQITGVFDEATKTAAVDMQQTLDQHPTDGALTPAQVKVIFAY